MAQVHYGTQYLIWQVRGSQYRQYGVMYDIDSNRMTTVTPQSSIKIHSGGTCIHDNGQQDLRMGIECENHAVLIEIIFSALSVFRGFFLQNNPKGRLAYRPCSLSYSSFILCSISCYIWPRYTKNLYTHISIHPLHSYMCVCVKWLQGWVFSRNKTIIHYNREAWVHPASGTHCVI